MLGFAGYGGTLFAQLKNGEIWRLAGKRWQGQAEGSICWQAESGAFPAALAGSSYVSALTLRVLLEAGSTLAVDLCYDESGTYTQVYAIAGEGKKTYRLPILPRLAGDGAHPSARAGGYAHLWAYQAGAGGMSVFLTRALRNIVKFVQIGRNPQNPPLK